MLLVAALVASLATPTLAAGAPVSGGQQTAAPSTDRRDTLDIPQVGARQGRLTQGPEQARDRLVAGSAERAAQSGQPLRSSPQVTAERGGAYVGDPVSRAQPSAEAPTSLTRLEEGRDTSAVVPTGDDRCDPGRGPLPAACDRVIEARASEFQVPDFQPLSAEQRLLANQRELRPTSVDVGTATRRLANGELDESAAALAIASVALQGAGSQPTEPTEDVAEPSSLEALVAGITTLVTGAPPNP